MIELQGYVWRKRKVLTRLGAALALCVACLLVVLPRADAHDPVVVAKADKISMLFSPEPVSSKHFAVLYPVTHS